MSPNIANAAVLAVFVACSLKAPRHGIMLTVLVVLCLPQTFWMFGFSFGAGNKYLPNLFIIGVFYTGYYFVRLARQRLRPDALDIVLIIYLILQTVITVVITGTDFNPGAYLKWLVLPILPYFFGKVIACDKRFSWRNYVTLRTSVLAVGVYMLASFAAEYVWQINVHAAMLSNFSQSVESQVIRDPFAVISEQQQANYYRVLGPQLEPTEAALVILIAFVAYLTWTDARVRWQKLTRYGMLVLLAMAIAVSGSRSALLAIPPVLLSYGLVRRRSVRRTTLAACVLLVLVACAVVAADSDGAFDELKQNVAGSTYFANRIMDQQTAAERLLAWHGAFSLIKTNLLCGVGVGTEVNLLGPNGSVLTSHNFYLDLLLLRGLVGTLLYSGIIVAIVRRSVKASAQQKSLPLARMAGTHVVLIVAMLAFNLANMEKVQISLMFWTYAGMISVLRKTMIAPRISRIGYRVQRDDCAA